MSANPSTGGPAFKEAGGAPPVKSDKDRGGAILSEPGASLLDEVDLPHTTQRNPLAAQESTWTTNAPLLPPTQIVIGPRTDSPEPNPLPTPSQNRRSSLSLQQVAQRNDNLQSSNTSRVGHMEHGSQETITRPHVSVTGSEAQPQALNTSPPSPSSNSITLAAHYRRPASEDAERVGSSSVQPHVRILQDPVPVQSPIRHGHPRTRSNSPPIQREANVISTSDTEIDARRRQQRSTSSGVLRGYHHPLPPLPGVYTAAPPSPHPSSRVDHSIIDNSAESQHQYSRQHTRRPQYSIGAGATADPGSRNYAFATGAGPSTSLGAHGPGMREPDDLRASIVAVGPSVAPGHPNISRSRTLNSVNPRSEVDWIIPLDDKPLHVRERTVGERLNPTLERAKLEREKYAAKAKMTGYTLNVAIGLQVVIGSLTTGLAVVTTGKQTSIMTAVLGGCATVIASFLARARGSHEPELSVTRVKDLEQYIRECEAFLLDYGHLLGSDNPEHQCRLQVLRNKFEELLGNGNGERKLEPA